jgi:hypothetical protein
MDSSSTVSVTQRAGHHEDAELTAKRKFLEFVYRSRWDSTRPGPNRQSRLSPAFARRLDDRVKHVVSAVALYTSRLGLSCFSALLPRTDLGTRNITVDLL